MEIPGSRSGPFQHRPSNGSVRDEANDEVDELDDDDNDDDAGPLSTQAGCTAARTAPSGVHYAIVQCLSHPRPVVLQLRATLHIAAENKSLRNRGRGAMEREGATSSRWHEIIASFIPGNDLIAGSPLISEH